MSRVVIYRPDEMDTGWRVQLEDEKGRVVEFHDTHPGARLPAAFDAAAGRFPEVEVFVPQGHYTPGLTPAQDVENVYVAASTRPADRGEA